MATHYVVDPTRFYAEGARVDWPAVARRLGIEAAGERLVPTLELRWMLHGSLGLPTEPFKVWARQHSSQEVQKTLAFVQTNDFFAFGSGLLSLPGHTLITWPEGSMSNVSLGVTSSAPGVLYAFAGGPLLENVNQFATVSAGTATIELSAPVIDGLLVPFTSNVTTVRGIAVDALSQAAGWTLVETVGLPVDRGEWAGIGRHGEPQGMAGSFSDAPTAALRRLERGAPPVGWGPQLAAGIPAPPWLAPDFRSLIKEVNRELLDFVRDIVAGSPPNQQANRRIAVPVPPPQNSSGQSVDASSSDSHVPPVGMALIAAGSDPFLSLALGFGTAYSFPQLNPQEFRLDFMITAHWEKGLDGASAPVDFAALVPALTPALAPPPPAHLTAQEVALLKPLARDGDWRGTSRISWDKQNFQLFRTASFAAARAGLAPPAATEALMDPRPSGGFRPVAISSTDPAKDPQWWRNHAVDRELPIPANPGARTVKYGIAVQDLYGQWTPWKTVDEGMQQPDLDQVRLVSARLEAVAPASGTVCPATLELEFLWDWSVRTPDFIQLAGLLYAAAEHGSPSPTSTPPAGFARTVGGGNPPLTITFSPGGVPSAPGAVFAGLDASGETNVGFGPVQGNEGRRYRMTLPGFALDFALSGHIGLALWARCRERIAPQRLGPWSTNPLLTAASDPRPPVVPIEHVHLASLPDAAGECHARIAWTPQPGAAGYFIYESDETQVLKALGLPEPVPSQTLDDRLKIVKDRFGAIPRRAFTRLNSKPLQGVSADVALPRGTTAIHFYVVLGISAGQVEGRWPTSKDGLIAVAAPHVMVPAPPTLEAQRFLDTTVTPNVYRVKVDVATRPGPRVQRIDLHRVRVDDAARELDTMGPPVARVQASGGGWTVTRQTDAGGVSSIQTVRGIDSPDGSWRRVWYRATAWTEQDDTRGGLPGRSPASTAAWVVVPPPDGPAVSAVNAGGGPTPIDIILQWSSPAPVRRTPLGPHVLTVRAAVAGAPHGTAPLLGVDSPLDRLDHAQPATGPGVWITGTAAGVTTYRALVRRAAVTDPVRFAVRVTDPLGRMGEALLDVAPGPVDPAPDLGGLAVRGIPFPFPPKLALEFVSSVPLVPPPDGPYLLRVSTFRKVPVNMVSPLLTKVEMPVGSVPIIHAGPVLPGLYRHSGSDRETRYLAVATTQTARFVVRITAPDGRFVEEALDVV